MRPLQQETDPKTLKQAALILEQENRRLVAKVTELTKENLQLKGESPELLQERIAQLEAQLSRARQELFGRSSEKRPRQEKADETTPAEPEMKRAGHGPREQPNLRVVEEIHLLDEPDKICPSCGGELKAWEGQFEEAEEIDVIEREFILKKHKRQKYRCSCQQCVETALGPPKLQEGGRYSIDFAIHVATDKYLDHMPLARQVRAMERDGLLTDTQTLWDQLNALATLLEPVRKALKEYLLSRPLLGVDETTWRMLKDNGLESNKSWYVWSACAADAVVYEIHDTRSTEGVRKLLGEYAGHVMADGYKTYETYLKEGGRYNLLGCWVHVRRHFVEIEERYPEEAGKALELIGKLYEIEARCQAGPAGDPKRRELRQAESKEVLKELSEWAVKLKPQLVPRSDLEKAVNYMSNQWAKLVKFVEDPALPLDNNATERAIRGPVVGRKNHYGSKSRRGTEVAALFYSLCESAKLAGVDPRAYLRAAVHAVLNNEPILLPHLFAKTGRGE